MKIEAQPCHTLENVSTPQMFCMNISVKLKMLGFIHIPDICFVFVFVFVYPYFNFPPHMFGTNMSIEGKLIREGFTKRLRKKSGDLPKQIFCFAWSTHS